MFEITKKIIGIFAALSIILFSFSQTSFATEENNERNLKDLGSPVLLMMK